ncbi:MAG: hypothetical protein KJ070_03830 [Verrucomicrobia bacterium]|nr:hypothetical protein [Verrucomicrobiota bacterium]
MFLLVARVQASIVRGLGLPHLSEHFPPGNSLSQNDAKNFLQLPKEKLPDNTWTEDVTKGRFKCILHSADVSTDFRLPRGYGHSIDGEGYVEKAWLEVVAMENPHRGGGGAVQYTEEPAVAVTVLDLKTGQVVQNKAHLQQILIENP